MLCFCCHPGDILFSLGLQAGSFYMQHSLFSCVFLLDARSFVSYMTVLSLLVVVSLLLMCTCRVQQGNHFCLDLMLCLQAFGTQCTSDILGCSTKIPEPELVYTPS
jgi:hypothetical protein